MLDKTRRAGHYQSEEGEGKVMSTVAPEADVIARNEAEHLLSEQDAFIESMEQFLENAVESHYTVLMRAHVERLINAQRRNRTRFATLIEKGINAIGG